MSTHSFKTSSAHKRSMENIMEPTTETDESGSLHFQAPKTEETTTTTTPAREQRVSFNSRVRCRRSKAPVANAKNLWYSKEDLASLRSHDKRLQSIVAIGTTSLTGDDDTEEISFVGLYSEKERKQRIKRIKAARECVLGEQMQQQEEFYDAQDDLSQPFILDQESIADFMSTYSKRATKVAHMKGLQVSWHVENFSEEESTADLDDSHRSCSQHSFSQRSCSQRSRSTSGNRPVRNSSIRSAGKLIARLTAAAS
ncbi:unnamed protein product [Cylindrotheca closterium]|uniref:Uncharacterized protein n=1 Tax=Cylindrotheca closterium TaxID=2856 RepID=A0AAD2GD46_9STRA|nr:unnamed protein product [Cylindrotheca closterium]